MTTIGGDLTSVFSVLTIIAQIVTVFILLALIFRNSWGRSLILMFGRRATLLAFVVSLLATVGSLMYSELAGYEPCKLCWLQRIFMYPQVVILGIALWKRRSDALLYSFALSLVGIVIATYHYLIQKGFVSTPPCSITGVSCDKVYSFAYGYITIPMMAIAAFGLIIVLFLVKRFYDRM